MATIKSSNNLDDGEYVGQLNGQIKHGQGTYVFPGGGGKYVGQWKDGKQHGKGTFTMRLSRGTRRTAADSLQYVGLWKDGKKHGQGTQTKFLKEQQRAEYVGAWKDGKMHGQGIQTLHNGDKYDGEWMDGKKHGQGTETRNGTSWSGEWENDKRKGQEKKKKAAKKKIGKKKGKKDMSLGNETKKDERGKGKGQEQRVRDVKDTDITRERELAEFNREFYEGQLQSDFLNLNFFDFLDMLEDDLWWLVEQKILELHEYLKGKVNLDELGEKKKRRHLT